MPVLKIKHVVSVSSEDKAYPAENLLKEDAYRGWKSSGSQRKAEVVLQLEKSSVIHSIDIGNEGSAFIEVLGGRLTDSDDTYHVLLVASSFMSPLESKQAGEPNPMTNRVRIFGNDKLTQAATDGYDRIKVVCTQPFNKDIRFGLTFIKFHSPPEAGKTASDAIASETKRIGSFSMKNPDDGSKLTPGSLFAKRKDLDPPLTGAAEIRAASAKAEAGLLFASTKAKTPSKRKPNDSVNEPQAKKPTLKSPAPSVISPKLDLSGGSNLKKPKNQKTHQKQVPFEKIMSAVVFVLSGFQNPLRADLRDKAIEMGAKYRPDWNEGCTHLICAFPETPKFQQVRKVKGKIVSKNWILDCHRKKSALPWSQYRMKGRNDDNDNDNDDDDDNSEDSIGANDVNSKSSIDTSTTTTKTMPPNVSKAAQKEPTKGGESDDEYGGSTDVDSEPALADDVDSSATDIQSAEDTDEEIKRAMKKDNEDYADDEVVDTSDLPMPELPNFFNNARFFFYGEFEEEMRRRLVRYVTAFNGEVEDCVSDKVTYVITKSEWNDDFDDALNTNGRLIFAKPHWLLACALKHRRVPHQPYLVVPRDM